MTLIRVVGVGSPFGDDQTGWRVAELVQHDLALKPYLKKRSEGKESIDILQSDRPGLTLLNILSNVDILFIVDAIKTARHQIGCIHQVDCASINSSSGFFSTHGFGIATAIALAKVMGKLPSQTIIYGVEIGVIDNSASLSQPVEIACQFLSREIAQELLAIVTSPS